MALKRKHTCPRVAGWMTTFTDMTTLLLTFFILLFTIAEIDGYELRLILSSFTGSFGIHPGGLTLESGPLAEAGNTIESLPAKQVGTKLAKTIKDFPSEFRPELTRRQIRFTETLEGFVISIPGQNYFEPDNANLTQRGELLIEKVAQLLLRLRSEDGVDQQVEIEGHASLEPETIDRLTSNLSSIWEHNLDLSTDRAKNVEKFLIGRFVESGADPFIRKGSEQRAKFIVKGFGEFQPTESNNTPEERAWNRRVDIVIKRE